MLVFSFRFSLLLLFLAYYIMPDCFLKRELEKILTERGYQIRLRRILKGMSYKEALLFEKEHAKEYSEQIKSPNYNKL